MTPELTVLTCAVCGEQVYAATPETYNREKVREAVDEHTAECRSRQPKPQQKQAHEVPAQ